LPSAVRTFRVLGTDIALWYITPAAFLYCYVRLFGQPATSIAPHVLLVGLPLLGLSALRLSLARAGVSSFWQRSIVAPIAALSIDLLTVYYALVLIGLKSWGGIIDWESLPTFFAQATILTDTIGLPPIVLPVFAMGFLSATLVGCWLYLGRFDWAAGSASNLSPATLPVLVTGVALIFALEVYQFRLPQWTSVAEPLSLTLYPQKAALDLEGYRVNPVHASHWDEAAERARATYIPASGLKEKNLVVIVIDALRPDHMGIYGYPRNTTPHLTDIARAQPTRVIRGVHATCADTVCGLYSLFTSKFTNEFSFRPFTLHEVLRRNGYRIHLILSGDHSFFFSLKTLYGHVDTFYDGTQAQGYFLNDDQSVLDRLAAMPDWDGQPTMFQFHLMSSHILSKPLTVPGPFQPARRYALANGAEHDETATAADTAINFYDNGVVRADEVVNSLLAQLRRKGYLRDTLVVVTADHGEALGEHGFYRHANSVREEVLRIPLLLIAFGYQPPPLNPQRTAYAQVDIAPCILTDLDLPVPSVWTGASCGSAGLPFDYFEEHSFAGMLDQRDPSHLWKYWVDRRTGADHVFDLADDPHETRDRLATLPAPQLAELRTRTRKQTSAGLRLD
jgi:glucan phosphoethanolaminetransferase (alkaline phosphatase superfamily)